MSTDAESTPTAAPGGLVERVDRFQQRHPAVGMPISVFYKYTDDGGGHLAALIAYYAFLSLFPLLLLASTILGIVLKGHPALQQQLLDSALSQLPVVGKDLGRPRAISGGVTGLVIGSAGALYGALGVGQAMQNAVNAAWTVPRNARGNPFAQRGKSVVLLLVIGGDVLGTTALAGLVNAAGFLGPVSSIAVLLASLLVHAAAFSFVFRFATTRDLTWREVLPGASIAAALWLALQYVGVAYVGRTVNHASDTNGVFAVVLGLLAFLYLISTMTILCLELDVVLVDRLHPRTLLTPFTDNVILTEGDERSYRDLATSQQLKGFERVHVEFDPSPAERRESNDERDDERA